MTYERDPLSVRFDNAVRTVLVQAVRAAKEARMVSLTRAGRRERTIMAPGQRLLRRRDSERRQRPNSRERC